MEERNSWQRPSNRYSRRRALASAALGSASLGAAALLGCAPSAPSPSGAVSQTAQPKRGGVLARRDSGIGGQARTFEAGLDPHPIQPTYSGIMTLFYQGLIRRNALTAELEPELGQRWEQPSQNEYLFHLSPGVKFHNKPPANGRAMTASDVVFSLDRIRTDDPRFQNRQLLASMDKVEAVNPSTVRITTKKPDVSILSNLAGQSVVVLAPEVVDQAGKFATYETAVGTGAFVLQTADDISAVAVRNPDYWKPGLPYLDTVRMQNISDDATAWAAFQANQIDLITNPLRGDEAKNLFDQQEGKPHSAQWYKDVSYTAVQVNLRKKPFDDARVSKAIRLLVDHEEATNQWAITWFGRGYLSAYLPAALEDWDFTEQEYLSKFLEFKRPKDEAVREALRLLGAAGYTRENPFRTSMNGYDSATAQAQAVLHQAQINKFGQSIIQVPELKLFSVAQSNSILAQGDFEIFSGNIVAPQPYDVDSWFTTMYVTNGGRNNGKWSDAKMDQMIDQQRTIFNLAERKAYVKEMLLYMMDNAPYTSWSGRYLLSVAQKKVKDWAPEGSSAVWGHNFEQVWLDA